MTMTSSSALERNVEGPGSQVQTPLESILPASNRDSAEDLRSITNKVSRLGQLPALDTLDRLFDRGNAPSIVDESAAKLGTTAKLSEEINGILLVAAAQSAQTGAETDKAVAPGKVESLLGESDIKRAEKNNGETVDFERTAEGQVSAIITRDKGGKTIKHEVPGGNSTTYQYDAKGNLTRHQTRDKDGKLLREGTADGTATHYDYDSKGELARKTTQGRDGTILKSLTGEQAKIEESMAGRADKLLEGIHKGTSTEKLYQILSDRYVDMQRLWYDAKKLPGNPKETMGSVLNAAFESKGVKVSFREPRSQRLLPWDVDTLMDVVPATKRGHFASAVFGLGGRTNDWVKDPNAKLLKPAR
jgi:YD repeat-containing protein